MCVLFLNTCSNALLHMQKGGLAITRTAKKHTTSYPVSISAGLMYNPGTLGLLTPLHFKELGYQWR